ncbi:hypothetical protein EIP91_011406 [Steccherinum ochraceum]|uniref:tRNA dimethylallyltransferase n=1 Tax=Steccherinum ochraceum TaxID=92696 RepID=A0A4R0R7I9_9APHY|nr:hypothetical protein EIP91_011406 [Steccherinum ochraceum]
MSLSPILAICGTTGVGKSKLAIELAVALSNTFQNNSSYPWRGARVINADAMQVYAGLDVLTNKVPVEEQKGVEHLLMGFKQPGEQYVVGQWVRDAREAIEETHRRKQLPIVVGGTSYWIQHLVFPGRLASSSDNVDPEQHEKQHASPSTSISDRLAQAIKATPPELVEIYEHLPSDPPRASTEPEAAYSLHSLLACLDPPVASRWHWKDTRKVLRSLEIIRQNGRLSSEIIQEQSQSISEPRYRSLFLWLYAKPEILNPRLDERVDEMMKRGLLQEVDDLVGIEEIAANSKTPVSDTLDFTLGIYQSIGYREFSQYLTEDITTDDVDKRYADTVGRMKTSTRQYAKRQVRWLRNTLLPVVNAANSTSRVTENSPVVPAYLLDATDLSTWDVNVQQLAERITRDFLEQKELPDPLSLSDVAREMLSIPDKSTNPADKLNARRKRICPTCTVDSTRPVMIEEGKEWRAHVGTKVHRRLATRSQRRPEDWRERAAAAAQEKESHSAVREEGSSSESDVDTSLLLLETKQ